MRSPVRFARLVPGLDLTASQVERLISRLATSDAPRPLVFETWAGDEGIVHFVGRTDSDRPVMGNLLMSVAPGTELIRGRRPEPPERIARLRLSPRGLPLSDSALEQTLHALYGVFAGRRKGETISLQLVFGRGRRPVQVPAKIADPSASTLQLLLRGVGDAPGETRKRVAQHAAELRVELTVRIGVSAAVPERRRQIRGQLLGALRQLEAPGTRLSLVSESAAKWQTAATSRGALPLTAAQATALLCWPLDELELPGLPPRHPRQLPPPSGITGNGAVFAEATAPGRNRLVGLDAESRLQHLAITGGTGSGKSQVLAALALDDIAQGRPLVLIEPKRQLVDDIVARAPKEAAGRIVIIDAADKHPVGFNPLDIGPDRDPGPVVDGILEVFKAVFSDGWGPRTEDLLHAGLLTLVADGLRRGQSHTLLDLVPLISDDGYRRTVVGAVASDVTLASYWATFDGLSPAHRASIAAAPLNKLRKYVLRKNVAAVLGQSRPRFRLRDVFKGDAKAVLVPLNDALIGPGAAQLLGGLVVAEIWLATQERALEADPKKRPGMVFIDEVQRYLHLPTSIDDALATSRSYGVGWHLALQGRAQVPVQMAEALALNARNQITFAASPKDARALAQTTTALTIEDFQALGRFEIYANLVADGAPAGWFAARTLPPAPDSGCGGLIRDANREQFAGDAAAANEQAKPGTQAPRTPPAVEPGLGSNQRRRRS
nr:TraM recognition domain-containing protein [Microbacterium sp. MRS-1]